MPYSTAVRAVVGALFLALLPLAQAQAQSMGFVATSGSDVNNCTSLADACRTLQRAHDVSSIGGKVVVLDSGDFASLTISKSIAIVATGVHGGIFNGLTSKITIDAGPDDVIDIDGLMVGRNAASGDNSGIIFNTGARLHVRNCTIRNFGAAGIYVAGGGAKQVLVSNSTIADNLHGVWARNGSHVVLDRVTVSGNLLNGVRSHGSGAVVSISNSTVVANGRGLNAVNGGEIVSFGNNVVHGNAIDGAPTTTDVLK